MHNKGEEINYDILVDQLSQLKKELMNKLQEERKRRITVEDVPIQPNRDVKEIYNALEKLGRYDLAARFRDASGNTQIVKLLKKALEEGRLLEEAEKILTETEETKPTINKPPKLKRICWCLITKETPTSLRPPP